MTEKKKCSEPKSVMMQKELKKILKENDWTGKELAAELGMSYGHYRKMTMDARKDPPNWVTAFVIGYNLKTKTE